MSDMVWGWGHVDTDDGAGVYVVALNDEVLVKLPTSVVTAAYAMREHDQEFAAWLAALFDAAYAKMQHDAGVAMQAAAGQVAGAAMPTMVEKVVIQAELSALPSDAFPLFTTVINMLGSGLSDLLYRSGGMKTGVVDPEHLEEFALHVQKRIRGLSAEARGAWSGVFKILHRAGGRRKKKEGGGS